MESVKTVKPDVKDIELVFGTGKTSSPTQDEHMVLNEINNDKNTRDSRRPNPEMLAANQPLLEPHKGRPLPPLAGPEVDDLDEHAVNTVFHPGIDDGLLDIDKHPNGDAGVHSNGSHNTVLHEDGNTDGKFDGGWDEPDGLESRFGEVPVTVPGIIPDVNVYQQKKIIAQGMMDLALLSANANQLRMVIETSATHPYYYPSVIFIAISIICQIAVGVGLILNVRYDVKDEKEICKADKINNYTVLGIFIITIVNVFITSFSVNSPAVVTVPVVNTG